MNLYFVIYSSIIQIGFEDTLAFKEALRTGAMIPTDKYNNELEISRVNDVLIDLIVKNHILDVDPNSYDSELLPIDGGLRIEFDNQDINHQCCSEINDFKNWEQILKDQSKIWKDIWIGHPWIYYKVDKELIYFSEYYDNNMDQNDIKTMFAIDKNDFFTKLIVQFNELYKFRDKLEKVISNGDFQNKKILIEKLMIK